MCDLRNWDTRSPPWWWWSPASGVHIHFFNKSCKFLNISNKVLSIPLKKIRALGEYIRECTVSLWEQYMSNWACMKNTFEKCRFLSACDSMKIEECKIERSKYVVTSLGPFAYHIPMVKVCLICCYTRPCHWHLAIGLGDWSLIAAQATAIIAAQTISKPDECKCHHCGKIIKSMKICSHVGGHILKVKMWVHEDGLQEQVFLYFKSCHFPL